MTLARAIEAVRDDGRSRVIRCPAHDDRRPSLSVSRGADGRVLVHCHAGCPYDTILSAAGVDPRDLAPRDGREPRDVVATYDYCDERGVLLYQVVRYEPKSFRQRRLDGAGGWIWNLDGVRRVLYRLPEIAGQPVAYVVEGEKDADRLAALGLPATTAPGGAGKWRPEYVEQLRAAGVTHVVVLPDADTPGRAHAATVARACYDAGLAVKVVELPGLDGGGDISDWLAAGHAREELVALVKRTPLYTPPSAPADGLALETLHDLLASPEAEADWLVENRVPRGGLALLVGKPKAGKSTLARALALAVARGDEWLGSPCVQGGVIYLAMEDRRADVRRHFVAMGATGDEPIRFLFRAAGEDIVARLCALAERDRPALIIVDTVQRLVRARDLNDYAEVTTRLTPILGLARESGAAVLLVHHASKGDRDAVDSPLGSTALSGSVDTVLVVRRREGYRTVESVQRVGDDLEATVVELDPRGRPLPAGTRDEREVAQAEAALLTALGAASEPLTAEAWLGGVEARRATKLAAVRRLVADGRVVKTGTGRRGDPQRYAVSGSLVPGYIGEPENWKRKNAASDSRDDTYSGSRNSPGSPEGWEPETAPTVEVKL